MNAEEYSISQSYNCDLNEGQGHSNLYQTVQCVDVYRNAMFERNWSVNVQIKPT